MVNVAVLGHGVVGSGVVEVLLKNHDSIAKRAGEEIEVKYVLDLRDFPDSPIADRFIKDFNIIADDPEIDVVVECMGGLHPSYDFVKTCLLSGKHVATSNKELVAAKGAELLKIAREQDVNFLFEASVGGGIPIIRPINQCLAANEVYEIAGILNGTTNFILTKMIHEQMSFSDALALAQQLGYAERNPAADVEGLDTCRKICILASLAFGRHIYPQEVHTEGITAVTLEDVAYAEDFDGVIKLLGWVKKLPDDRLAIMVSPAIVGRGGQLAGVEDVFNAILVRGDAIGDVVFYGRGAGKLPTASAVVADVIDSVKHLRHRSRLFWEESVPGTVADHLEVPAEFYVRLKAEDPAALLSAAKAELEVKKVLHRADAPDNELAFITGELPEGELNGKLETLEKQGVELLGKIRVCDY